MTTNLDTMHPSIPQVTALDPVHIPLATCDSLADKLTIKLTALTSAEWTKDKLTTADLLVHAAPAVASGTIHNTEGESGEYQVSQDIDDVTDKLFTELIALHQFSAKEGSSVSARCSGGGHYGYATLVGLGEVSADALDCEVPSFINSAPQNTDMYPPAAFGRLGKVVGLNVSNCKSTSLVVSLKGLYVTRGHIQAFVERLVLSLNTDTRFKSKKVSNSTKQLTSINIYVSTECMRCAEAVSGDACLESIMGGVRDGWNSASGVDLAKQLTTTPPNFCNPPTLAKFACEMAMATGLSAKILGPSDMQERNMGAFLAVGKGSLYPPHLIHLTYSSPPTDGKPLRKFAFVGKGVTMDTGGYNLKVNSMIELMKWDMGGSAAVLGAAKAISHFKPQGIVVHFIVGAAENMISMNAYRPGDVITASNGTSIEVGNTDAEGRLVLSDCLIYADSLGVELIIDLATLTGASMVGLGRNIGCLYGSNSKRVKDLLKCAHTTAENLWPMPLYKPYKTDFDSRCADVTNCASTRLGGSIHAALFLQSFVTEADWCHIDMAGPTWDYKDQTGSGFGVRTLTQYARCAASDAHCT